MTIVVGEEAVVVKMIVEEEVMIVAVEEADLIDLMIVEEEVMIVAVEEADLIDLMIVIILEEEDVVGLIVIVVEAVVVVADTEITEKNTMRKIIMTNLQCHKNRQVQIKRPMIVK